MTHRRRETLIVWTAAVLSALALVAAGGLAWALTPYGPAEEALTALVSDDSVRVEERPEGWVFSPADDTARVGLVLYPGARVDARSYAPLAREIASRGYLVVVQPMRLNLAVLSAGRADEAVDAHPEVLMWAVGGHSLGGAMAARYADTHAEKVDGLAMLAAYPPHDNDLSDQEIAVVSVFGTADGVLDSAAFQESVPLLPKDASFVEIAGGNHAGFGAYGEQPGDNLAEISSEDQTYETADAIVTMLLPFRIQTR